MTLHIGPKPTHEGIGIDLQPQEALPLRPGLITEKSLCCSAPVITVGRGLHGEICQKCGKPHDSPRLK